MVMEKMRMVWTKTWSVLKKKSVWISLAVVVVIGGGWMLFGRGGSVVLPTTAVARGTVISQVSITGTVKPEQSLDLAFLKSGRITRIPVQVGDFVQAGQTLAVLDNADLYAQLAQAKAQVQAQQAQLNQLLAGATPESIQVSQAAVDQAQQGVANAYSNVINILSDAYAKSQDAVKNQTSLMFSNGDSANPQLTFSSNDQQAVIDSQNLRLQAGIELVTWGKELHALQANPSNSQLDTALQNAQGHIAIVRSFLNRLLDALNGANSLSPATLAAYQTSISTARTNVNAAASEVNAQQQGISAAIAALASAQDALKLKEAPATKDQIAAQQALVDQAQAQVAYDEAQIANTVLSAPFSGTVTKVINNVGDIVAPNAPVVSLIGSGAFEIETYVAESDIAKIRPGQDASVTLDAYGNDVVFQAKVLYRDLSQTMLDGVATYKTTLQFTKKDPRILPGLTANVDIMVAEKDNVLFVPTRDIIDNNGSKFVLVPDPSKAGATKQVPVTVGLRGSDGRTEIVSGLAEGDRVVSE